MLGLLICNNTMLGHTKARWLALIYAACTWDLEFIILYVKNWNFCGTEIVKGTKISCYNPKCIALGCPSIEKSRIMYENDNFRWS